MIEYRDRSGAVIDHTQYLQLQEDPSYRILGFDRISRRIRVSTIWMGFDIGINPDVPTLFESIIFVDGLEHTTRRYASESDVLAGHAALVADAKILAMRTN